VPPFQRLQNHSKMKGEQIVKRKPILLIEKGMFRLFNVTHQPFQPPFSQAESLRSEGSQPASKFAQGIAHNPDLLSLSCKKNKNRK
jgi:hypothetical protein